MLDSHQIDRTFMKWRKKVKKPCFENGTIVRKTIEAHPIPVKYLTDKEIESIITMLKRNPPGMWCGFKSDQWLQVLEEEISYRNRKVNFFIGILREKFQSSEFKQLLDKMEVGH